MSKALHKKNKHYRYLAILLPLVVLMLFSSCSARRQVIKEPLKLAPSTFVLDELAQHEFRFNWFSAKFSIDYIYNKKLTEFKGQIRIRKDSVIWISFSPALGIEMARVMITTDSVLFMNRINKNYLAGDYRFVSDFLKTTVDFDILQALIIGNDFQFYEKTKFKTLIDNGEYKLSTAERHKLKKFVKQGDSGILAFYHDIWLNPDNFKISRVTLKEIAADKKLDAYYGDFREEQGQLFPYDLVFEVVADENIRVEVKYSRIRVDEPLTFPFSIPEKYDRIY